VVVVVAKVNISYTIDTSRFRERYQKYLRELHTQLESNWDSVLAACIEDILTRTPTPEVEYAYVMGFKGGAFVGEHLNPSTSSDGQRIPFIREPGKWLEDLVKDPATYELNTPRLEMGIGNVSILEEMSKFSWTNWNKADGAITHTSDIGTWGLFEFGPMTFQFARFAKTPNGYTLKPYGDDAPSYVNSIKNYPSMGIYTKFHPEVFRKSVLDFAKQVEF